MSFSLSDLVARAALSSGPAIGADDEALVRRAMMIGRARERARRDRRLALGALGAAVAASLVGSVLVAGREEVADRLAVVTTGSGDELSMLAGSSFVIERDRATDCRVRVARGAVLFDVRSRDAGATFEVSTETATVRVVGTVFAVAIDERGGTSVEVFEGAVELEDANGVRRLAAGDRESGRAGALLDALADVGRERALGRRARQLVTRPETAPMATDDARPASDRIADPPPDYLSRGARASRAFASAGIDLPPDHAPRGVRAGASGASASVGIDPPPDHARRGMRAAASRASASAGIDLPPDQAPRAARGSAPRRARPARAPDELGIARSASDGPMLRARIARGEAQVVLDGLATARLEERERAWLRADALRALRRTPAAIDAYASIAASEDPERREASYLCARLMLDAGRASEVLPLLDASGTDAVGSSLRERALPLRARALVATGDPEGAADAARQYLVEFPGGASAPWMRLLVHGGTPP